MINFKQITFLLFLSLSTIYCCKRLKEQKAENIQTEISAADKEKIKTIISGRVEEIIKGAKALDAEMALKPYNDDKEFMIVNPDGSVMDYTEMKKSQTESMASMKSLDFKTIKKDFTFLSDDIVVITWSGANTFELKTGEKYKIDRYVGSMTFKKIGEEWKIVYAHEVASVPEIIK